MGERAYLDYNATTPLLPSVINAMTGAFKIYGNPSSVHSFGRQARACIESAREAAAAALEARPEGVVFTSGGTEANNMVIKGFLQNNARMIISAIEHESLNYGIPNAVILPVHQNGQIDVRELKRILSSERSHYQGLLFVAVMMANNETGVIQPLKEIIGLAKAYKAWVHCDAVQALGKMPLSFKTLQADSMSISAHKIGGPKGVGALILNNAASLPPFILGGGQERGLRAGTENTVGIIGFGAAIKDVFKQPWPQIQKLRDRLEKHLREKFPEVPIYGSESPRLPNTSCIGMPGVQNQTQLIAFDLQKVALSSGAACSSGKVKPSHVLKAMGIPDKDAAQALRVSLGWTTTQDDIDHFIDVWSGLYTKQMNGIFRVA